MNNVLSKIVRAPQPLYDALSLTALLVALISYAHNLTAYLAELSRPWPIMFGFWTSVGFAAWYEWQTRYPRHSIAKIAATITMFAIGLFIATHMRAQYVAMRAEFWATPGLADLVGQDMVAAANNKIVGYGGFYAAALLILRWTIFNALTRLFIQSFVPPESRPPVCPHCGQLYLSACPNTKSNPQ